MISKISNYTMKTHPLNYHQSDVYPPFSSNFQKHTWLSYQDLDVNSTVLFHVSKLQKWLTSSAQPGGGKFKCQAAKYAWSQPPVRQEFEESVGPGSHRRLEKRREGRGEMPREPRGGALHQNKACEGLSQEPGEKAFEGFELGKPGVQFALAVMGKAKTTITTVTTTNKHRTRLKLWLAHLSPMERISKHLESSLLKI